MPQRGVHRDQDGTLQALRGKGKGLARFTCEGKLKLPRGTQGRRGLLSRTRPQCPGPAPASDPGVRSPSPHWPRCPGPAVPDAGTPSPPWEPRGGRVKEGPAPAALTDSAAAYSCPYVDPAPAFSLAYTPRPRPQSAKVRTYVKGHTPHTHWLLAPRAHPTRSKPADLRKDCGRGSAKQEGRCLPSLRPSTPLPLLCPGNMAVTLLCSKTAFVKQLPPHRRPGPSPRPGKGASSSF